METQAHRPWTTALTVSELARHRAAEAGGERGHAPRAGLYVPLSAQPALYKRLTELSREELPSPLLVELSSLEQLSALAHLELTVRAPHAPLPGVLFRAARLQLSVTGEPKEAGGLVARALYELLAHVPDEPAVSASWIEHADGAFELTLSGERWSVGLSVYKGVSFGRELSLGRAQLSATELDTGEALYVEASLRAASQLEEVTEWTERGRERLGRALTLLMRAQRAGHASLPQEARVHESAQLHPSVVLSGAVQVGAQTKVWHFSKLLGPLEVGPRCNLGQNVVVERHARLGENVKVQNNVSIYSGVILEDDVFCGPSMVFTNIGTPRSHYPRRGSYQETRVKRGASIGANATVVCGSTIGRYALIGAGAVVTRDVPDYALAFGNPARVQGWVCYCGEGLDLGRGAAALEGRAEASCAECGRGYERNGSAVSEREPA